MHLRAIISEISLTGRVVVTFNKRMRVPDKYENINQEQL